MNGRERGSAAARHSQAFLIDSLQRLVMRLEQRMDLIRRIHDLSDGDIMIHESMISAMNLLISATTK